jgi:hypothetical protein
MSLLSTIQSTANWYAADSTHLPKPHRGLLTVIKTPLGGVYIETDVRYWQEQGIWIDPSGDPIEGDVLLWTYVQELVPSEVTK